MHGRTFRGSERAQRRAARQLKVPQDALLNLQRGVGNQHVGQILDRFKADEADARPETKQGPTLELPGLGTFDLASLQIDPNRTQVNITLEVNDKTLELQRAMLAGKHFPEATIKQGPLTIKLKDVYLTNFSVSGGTDKPMASISLDYRNIDQKYTPDDDAD
jgi:hypothetical protein